MHVGLKIGLGIGAGALVVGGIALAMRPKTVRPLNTEQVNQQLLNQQLLNQPGAPPPADRPNFKKGLEDFGAGVLGSGAKILGNADFQTNAASAAVGASKQLASLFN